jgi:hypothetical protein
LLNAPSVLGVVDPSTEQGMLLITAGGRPVAVVSFAFVPTIAQGYTRFLNALAKPNTS